MPTLTRRRSPGRQDCSRVFYGDVCVGPIARREGVPNDVDQWGWGCGFYPRTDPGEGSSGTAETFDEARAAFEAAWQAFLPTRTEADFQAWRGQRDWTTWKYAMWDAGLSSPTDSRAASAAPRSISAAWTSMFAMPINRGRHDHLHAL